MSDEFERSLKEFSEKHGAVLLGMHHEIQSMQKSIAKSEVLIDKAQSLSEAATGTLEAQQKELLVAKDELNALLVRQLQMIKTDLDSEQKKSAVLYEKAFGLLAEHKERDIDLKRREARLHTWLKRVELGILACLIIVIFSLWYLVWSR